MFAVKLAFWVERNERRPPSSASATAFLTGPRLAPTAEGVLPAHAVVTVEPGVYFPGWGGVRLEDDLYLGDEGPELLSDGRTELVELV